MQASCYDEIRAQAEQRIAQGEKVLVILSETAPSGIAGLLAGNLKEEFNRPAIVFCPKRDLSGDVNWTGSARSIDAFHMLAAIEQCSEHLLRYGGHKLAAGLTIASSKEKLDVTRRLRQLSRLTRQLSSTRRRITSVTTQLSPTIP